MTKSKLSKVEKTSYALGLDVGQSFKRLPIEIDLKVLCQGIEDIFKGNEILISQEEFKSTLSELQEQMKAEGAKLQEKATKVGAKNKEEGEN